MKPLSTHRPDYDALAKRDLTFAEAQEIHLAPVEEKELMPMSLLVAAGRRLIEELAVPPCEGEFYKRAG